MLRTALQLRPLCLWLRTSDQNSVLPWHLSASCNMAWTISIERQEIPHNSPCRASRPHWHQANDSTTTLAEGQPQAEDIVEVHLRLLVINRSLQAALISPSGHANWSQGGGPDERGGSNYFGNKAPLEVIMLRAQAWTTVSCEYSSHSLVRQLCRAEIQPYKREDSPSS